MHKKILVFPCGSEIGLEIHRSLRWNKHFSLLGASSVSDHGEFVYERYVGDIPMITSPAFIEKVAEVIVAESIDAIYPTMDKVAAVLQQHRDMLPCPIVGSPAETVAICASKKLTYRALEGVLPLAKYYDVLEKVDEFPIFIKQDDGYGSRCQALATSRAAASAFVKMNSDRDFVFCEYLPGDEFTIDCFTDGAGRLLFAGPRKRMRVLNGISVRTAELTTGQTLFKECASNLNKHLRLRGAWFFQMKKDATGEPRLLEVAARLGGSSSLFRMKGINFAALTLYDHFELPVEIVENTYSIVLDRSLSNRYVISACFTDVYIDYDDCLVIDGKINCELMAFLCHTRNAGKRLHLLTRHRSSIMDSLAEHRLERFFDSVTHITDAAPKSKFITARDALFIDDAHAERLEVAKALGIPTCSPDMVPGLLSAV